MPGGPIGARLLPALASPSGSVGQGRSARPGWGVGRWCIQQLGSGLYTESRVEQSGESQILPPPNRSIHSDLGGEGRSGPRPTPPGESAPLVRLCPALLPEAWLR